MIVQRICLLIATWLVLLARRIAPPEPIARRLMAMPEPEPTVEPQRRDVQGWPTWMGEPPGGDTAVEEIDP